MSASGRVLLINPTITSRRSARFPLAVLSLAQSLEGRYETQIIDGNVDRDFVATAVRAVRERQFDAVGITVMGGPQLPTAIAVSKAIREHSTATPIVWGGYFPTVCPVPAISEPYVDFVVRGQGEATFAELLDALHQRDQARLPAIAGLTWRRADEVVHNADRAFSATRLGIPLRYDLLGEPRQYVGIDVSGAPYCWLSGGARLQVPLYVLWCRDDVSRKDGAATRRASGA